jgi:hypothetical protein
MLGVLLRSKVFFALGCVATAILSFGATLMLLDRPEALWSSSPAVVAALPAGTPSSSLADLPPLPDSRFSWLGVGGIHAKVVGGEPVVSGGPMLRLIAVEDGLHTVAVRLSGLPKNEKYRIAAWIRPQAGANFAIGARDQADKENGPNNGGAIFDLAARKVLSPYGNAKPGIEQIGDWLKVWLDLPTMDGQFVVNFSVCKGSATNYAGDGKLGVALGGMAVD